MTEKDKEIQADYKNRINRVFEFIDQNLESDLSLNAVSEIAFFSSFHFHRVFKFVTEQTLHEYVKRRRIEKSASDLLHKNITATEIAHKYGFSDNSSFSRAFKKYFGVSPTEFKNQNPNRFSKIRQLKSKNGQEYPDYEKYICVINNLKNWIKMNAKIEIKEMSKMDLAYVSSIGPHNLENAYAKLMQWATPTGLMNDQTKMITIYHDSFKVTEANKVRMTASILLDKPVETIGEIGLTTIEAGKFIVGNFEIGLNEFEKSWTGLFVWMNENGYKKADREPFEIYYNNFNEHPERKAIVDFCIPIE
ncbi:AraC family transcriptional regulator [Flavobacterium reichenbachii]|uniref:AraC family transcriptional regulator n=1 Tax=Flavobacterium reichenbachii TaxID=362418 RepID=A0A085ZQ67_9FLAO|nr:GyrI-like domain-containing protein [Flavobacterium reichenbachii]KFF06581.1 AraC family transcriptional regulator [Flavobacterium reichenbachii]OXB18814.1 AraC family transcriptional regulator [Flavobacterium reichenbachii]